MILLEHEIAVAAGDASRRFHRLVLVVGPPRSGKTQALRALCNARGWPLLRVNAVLAERMLELTKRQRALKVTDLLDDLLQAQPGEVVLLDNIEMLFHPELQQDPLLLLQSLARNRTVVATWRGHFAADTLIYAAPEHPEYHRYRSPDAHVIVAPSTGS